MIISIIFVIHNNNGSVTFENFPLQQTWITKIGENVINLSTDGTKLIFVETMNGLFALDKDTGRIIWKMNFQEGSFEKSIEIPKKAIFISNNGILWAIDPKTGAIIWHKNIINVHPEKATIRSFSNKLLALEVDQDIQIYSTLNGDLLWTEPACRNKILAYIIDNKVFVPCYGIKAFNLITGELLWEIENQSKIVNAEFDEGIIYFSPQKNIISAFNLKNQHTLWKEVFPSVGYLQFKSHDKYLIVSDKNRICLFDKYFGEMYWCTRGEEPQNPVIIQNIIYAYNGSKNSVVAYNVISGKMIGAMKIRNLCLNNSTGNSITNIKDQLIIASNQQIISLRK